MKKNIIMMAGYVAGNDPAAGRPGQAVEWVAVGGGKFTMGTDDGTAFFNDAKPIHEANIHTFEMSKTLVTVEQYAECVIKGARLPSEAEYEYAATSQGKNQKHPWGNEDATPDRVVMSQKKMLPMCSKPAGNAKVSGGELCDMVGNVWQWVQDRYQNSYAGAPTDGSAFEGSGSRRVVRGGAYHSTYPEELRADYRSGRDPDDRNVSIGFRLARSSRPIKK
jgi:formylglycine-generating enzyme required for sulfatase activity